MLWSSLLSSAAAAVSLLAQFQPASAFTSTPFNPSSYPLAVRSPYTSAWLPGGSNGGNLPGQWAQFWNGPIQAWTGYVKVDGTTYIWMGSPNVAGPTVASQVSSQFTATKSIFVIAAGPVQLTATFLSPVEPTDALRSSVPFSYLTVTVKSTDGKSHSVQVYTDISGEWVATDNTQKINWAFNTNSNTLQHSVQLATQDTYGESGDIVKSGAVYHAVQKGSAITYEQGQDTVVRAAFINNGKLDNSLDTTYRAISDRWPVFAYSKDLGSTSDSTGSPLIFGIGHARTPSIQYNTGKATVDRYPYWVSKYANAGAMMDTFLTSTEYNHAVSAANTFDSKIQSDGGKISSNYAALLALSARQVMGAVESTISKNSDGSWNTNDVLWFMKEISSDGNVNTVDVISPSWPFWLYVNPTIGKQLLQPLFTYQASGAYPNKWSIHDIGGSYPKALGHNDGGDEAMPVEESGNMLVMSLSYAQKTGDLSILKDNYNLLKQWTGYLVQDALIPSNQISTDDFEGALANQTNLAIKGIVGIAAMAQVANLTGNAADAKSFLQTAQNYVTKFQGYAKSNTGAHLTLAYNNDDSWGIKYNLYGDKLLKLNLFPQSIYTQETAWYKSHASAYGTQLDTRHSNWAKSDWQIWTAAIVTDDSLRQSLINGVYKRASDGQSTVPFSDWYDSTSGGDASGFKARPVVGGHFAILTL